MKKTGKLTLTILAVVGMSMCNRRRMDPCQPETFNEQACQSAVNGGGYYYQGSWYPMHYSHPYPYYYDSYHTYVSRGGTVNRGAAGAYSHPSSGVTRGGFGSIGAGHSSGG